MLVRYNYLRKMSIFRSLIFTEERGSIMNYTSSWDFTMANYDAVWAFLVQMGLLLLFLMLGNILRRMIPFFRKCLIPSALLGGALLLVVH